MMRTCSLLAVTFAAALATSAQADVAKDYNMFVIGNMTAVGSDTEGRLAVGGNATLRNYSVGAVLPDATNPNYNLAVGGTLTRDGGSTKGRTAVHGAGSFTNYGSAAAPTVMTNVATAAMPVDFAAEGAGLRSLSTYLAGKTANGSVAILDYSSPGYSHGFQMTLTGTDAVTNVFSLNAADLARVNTLTIKVKAGSQVLINVAGAAGDMNNMGYSLTGVDETRILYNFANATSLGFQSIGVLGSVLAPFADLGNSSGVIQGQVFVGSYSGGPNWGTSIQVNNRLFAGTLLDTPANATGGVPEPATWATMLLGFGLAGAALRRGRRAVPA